MQVSLSSRFPTVFRLLFRALLSPTHPAIPRQCARCRLSCSPGPSDGSSESPRGESHAPALTDAHYYLRVETLRAPARDAPERESRETESPRESTHYLLAFINRALLRVTWGTSEERARRCTCVSHRDACAHETPLRSLHGESGPNRSERSFSCLE